MNRWTIAVMVLAPLAAGPSRELAAQESAQAYHVHECGRIGISFAPTEALVVAELIPGSPAERAGIQPSDTLVAVDGTPASRERLPALARRLEPGGKVRLRLRREGRGHEVEVVPERDTCVEVVRFGAVSGRAATAAGPPAGLFIIRGMLDSLPGSARAAERNREFLERIAHQEAMVDSLFWWMRESERHRLDSLRRNLVQVGQEHARQRERLAREFPEAWVRVEQDGAARAVIIRPTPVTDDEVPTALHVGRRAVAGVEFTELNPQLATYFHGAEHGLLVIQVAPGTPGARTGFQPGDVVVAVSGEPVRSIPELRLAIAKTGPEPVSISIVRGGRRLQLIYPRNP